MEGEFAAPRSRLMSRKSNNVAFLQGFEVGTILFDNYSAAGPHRRRFASALASPRCKRMVGGGC
jgi:hypothetical protein